MRMANDGFNEISKLYLMVGWPLSELEGGGTVVVVGGRDNLLLWGPSLV